MTKFSIVLFLVALAVNGCGSDATPLLEPSGDTEGRVETAVPGSISIRKAQRGPIGDGSPMGLTVPSGFFLTDSWSGVRVYQKNWSGGQPDYVVVVDLRIASIKNLTGSVSGTPCASYGRKTLGPGFGTYWADASADPTRPARVVLNGTFFSTAATPTPLAFGLKSGWSVQSYGYAASGTPCPGRVEFPGLQHLFMFDSSSGYATIEPYSTSALLGPMPEGIGGLDPLCCKGPSTYTGRTFVGVSDEDRDGFNETVFFFASAYATQSGTNGADNTLKLFGAQQRVMLDGGGSTGLVVNGSARISTSRTLPHAIAIYSSK